MTTNDDPVAVPVEGFDWAVLVAFGVGLAVGVLVGITVWALYTERRWQRASLGSREWWRRLNDMEG